MEIPKSPHFESQICNPMSHYGKSFSYKTYKAKIKKYIILRLYQCGPFQKKWINSNNYDSCLNNNSFACSEGNQREIFFRE